MKEMRNEIEFNGAKYNLVFNLNVMEVIQDEYGTLEKWGTLTDASKGEPNVKAVKFGFLAMINEGIDIDNEENGTNIKPLTEKQVGRLLTEIGLANVTQTMNKTVIDSTKSDEKKE